MSNRDIFPYFVTDFERTIKDARHCMDSHLPGLEEPIDFYRTASQEPRLLLGTSTQVKKVLDGLSTAQIAEISELLDHFPLTDRLLALLALQHYTTPQFSE